MIRITAVVLAGLLALIWGCADEPGVLLRFDYQPGEMYTYNMVDDVADTYEEDGEPYVKKSMQRQRVTVRVLEHDAAEDAYQLSVRYQVVDDTAYYSENLMARRKDSPEKPARMWDYALTMRRNGEIVRADGPDERSTTFYETFYKSRQPVFPPGPISPGYKWKQKIYLSMPENEPVPVVIKYHFEGFEQIGAYNCAVIRYFSEFEKVRDLTPSSYNKEGHKQLMWRNRIASEGSLHFAVDDGIVVRKEARINSDVKWDILDKHDVRREALRQSTDIEKVDLVGVSSDSSEYWRRP